MAECTPNFRASYDAEETTPRPVALPPTATGLPISLVSFMRSTETKKQSRSRCAMYFLEDAVEGIETEFTSRVNYGK